MPFEIYFERNQWFCVDDIGWVNMHTNVFNTPIATDEQ